MSVPRPRRREVQHLADDPQHAVRALPRRHEGSIRSVNRTRPTLSLLRIAENASSARDLGRELALGCAPEPKRCDALSVDQQHHGQLALLDEALDVRLRRCAR